MHQRDFIIVQIEELGRVIAQMLFNRRASVARKNAELIQVVYTSLNIDQPTLMNMEPDDLVTLLNKNDRGGLQRLDIAIKTLIEASYLLDDRQVLLLRAKELLLYLQTHDKTFSLERMQLLEDIDGQIN